jgi:hypothetical protein
VIDVERGAHLADAIDSDRRGALDGIFRPLRADGAIDRATRERLIDGIAALLDGV